MDLPSSREIELETLLRQRDAQVQDLTDEVTHLRQYLANQPSPSTTDPVSLPPSLVSLLLPHVKDSGAATGSPSNTITAALTQRVKVLQEENDELYELLKSGETGKLKEDVRSLRRVVLKLEGALRESHQVISNLSDELDKAHATIMSNNRPNNYNNSPRTHSQSPALRSNNQLPSYANPPSNGSAKPVPTGPRAHKKPRLSDAPTSVPPHLKPNRSQGGANRRNDSRDHSPRGSIDRKTTPRTKMEVDEDPRVRPRTPDRAREGERERDRERNAEHERERDRDRDRDRAKGREREKERDRERDRDRDRQSKRNGAYGGSSGGGGGGGGGGGNRRGHRSSNANSYASGDRTLAERMGL